MDRREILRRAYERGRGWWALERAVPALGFGLVAWFAGGPATSMVLSMVLAAAAWGLSFSGGPMGRAVPFGLAVGLIPFALPLVVRGTVCPLTGACDVWCIASSLTGGLVAGAWLGWSSREEPDGAWWLVSGVALAASAGALGCACVGASGLAAMVGGAIVAAPTIRTLLVARSS